MRGQNPRLVAVKVANFVIIGTSVQLSHSYLSQPFFIEQLLRSKTFLAKVDGITKNLGSDPVDQLWAPSELQRVGIRVSRIPDIFRRKSGHFQIVAIILSKFGLNRIR